MIRTFFILVGCLLTASLMGCSQGGKAIYAAAPDSNFSTSYTVRDGGKYSLYRVTRWNQDGQPENAEKLATYDLRPNERVGFNWVVDHSRMYDPDAHMNLQAYAGGNHINLGPIVSKDQKYYWADPSAWGSYWSGEPGRQFNRTLSME